MVTFRSFKFAFPRPESYDRPTAELLGLTLATALLPPPRKGRSCSALVEAVPRPNDGAPLKHIGRFGLWTKLDLEILQADGFVNDEDIMGI